MASPVVVKILGDSKGLSTALTGAKGQLEAFRLSTNKGMLLAGGAMAGFAVVGAAALKEAFDLDQIERDFATSTGLMGDDLDAAMGEMLDAAGQVPESFEAVGAAAGNLQTSTGFLGDDLENLTVQFLDLNRLGFGALNENQVGELINNWGLSAEEAEKSFDILAQVSQATGTDIGMMADMVTSNGGAFRKMGLSVEDSVALIGQWEKAGIDVNKAVRGLNSNLDMLQDQGADTDAMLAMMSDTMDDGVVSAAEATNLYDLFGAEATDLISALESGSITLDDFTASMGLSGQSVEEMATANASLGEKFSELKNKIMAEVAPALLELADGITVAVDWLLAEGVPAVQAFGAVLKEKLGPILDLLADTFQITFGILRDVWEAFSAFMSGDWDAFWENIGQIFSGVWDLIKNQLAIAVEQLKLVWAGFKAVFGELVSDTVDAVVDFFTGLPGRLWELASDFASTAKDLATEIMDGILEGVSDMADAVWAPIESSAKAVFNAVARAWNNSVGSLSFTAPDWVPGIGGKGFSVPNIPYASAEGGVFTKPTLTWVGEAGPEMVMPWRGLPAGNTAPGASPLPAMGRGDVNVYVETNADPLEIGSAVAWRLATGGI